MGVVVAVSGPVVVVVVSSWEPAGVLAVVVVVDSAVGAEPAPNWLTSALNALMLPVLMAVASPVDRTMGVQAFGQPAREEVP